MTDILIFIAAVVLVGQAIIGLAFFISCIWERETRATVFSGIQFLGMAALVVLFFFIRGAGYFESTPGLVLLVAGLISGIFITFLLMRKSGANPKALEGTKGLITGDVKRFDEREQVFARNRTMRPGSEQYNIFYKEHPDYEEFDRQRREKGGVSGRPGSIDKPYGQPNIAAAGAGREMCRQLSTPEMVKPQALPIFQGKKVEMSPEEASERIKGFTRNLGADMVGITAINPLWLYSRRGEIFHENWKDWGKGIVITHKYAIVFGTEMSFNVISAAPHTPTSIESSTQYAKGAFIATSLAKYTANLGYSATANHLRYYDALMVPLAVDAGLGELGRHGYMITKKLGPRLRLGAVTTDLPLIPDRPVDIGVEDFCRICKKCAVCCPSSSIPEEDQEVHNGTRRWKLNAETCFDYWGKVGTGCNICMRVCPWSHARTFPHKLIVEWVARNHLARRIFNLMDDIFYGRKPKARSGPRWAKYDGPWE